MTRRARWLCLLLLAGLLSGAVRAAAVAYYPLVHHEPGEETLMRTGTTVYLFHSGTEDTRVTLHVGDVLTVIRVRMSCESVEVGTVRLVAFIGGNYLQAKVVSGAVKPNDIAREGTVSCLVLAAQPCERK